MTDRSRFPLLTALFAACAAYGSFVPLVWRRVGWAEGVERFAAMPFRPFEHLGTGDFYTNILVFLPIGFFGTASMWGRGFSPAIGPATYPAFTTAVIVIACAVFSGLLELGQVYIAARTPSWSDIFAQTLGAALGVGLWTLGGDRILAASASPLRARTSAEGSYRLLALYAAGWTTLSALPLFFPRLAHPQLELWRARLDVSPLTLLGPLMLAGLAAVPLGAFAALFARRHDATWRAAVPAVLGPALLMGADRVRQVQFLPTEGHLAAGLVGFAAGWLAASPLGDGVRQWLRARRPLASATGLLLTSAFLLAHYWAPFNFGVRPATLEYRVRILYERAPFHRYYWTPPLIALGEAVTLLMLGGLFSALVHRLVPRLPTGACTALTALVFAMVEWGQLHLPTRRADPTDVMLATLGAFTGAAIARALEASPPPPPAGS